MVGKRVISQRVIRKLIKKEGKKLEVWKVEEQRGKGYVKMKKKVGGDGYDGGVDYEKTNADDCSDVIDGDDDVAVVDENEKDDADECEKEDD